MTDLGVIGISFGFFLHKGLRGWVKVMTVVGAAPSSALVMPFPALKPGLWRPCRGHPMSYNSVAVPLSPISTALSVGNASWIPSCPGGRPEYAKVYIVHKAHVSLRYLVP